MNETRHAGEDSDLAELLADWCREVSPRGENTTFELYAAIDGEEAFLRWGDAAGKPWSRHDAGCLQDILLAATVAQLADAGALAPTDAIGEFLPELMEGRRPGAAIHVGDLLCHASGYWPPPREGSGSGAYSGWSALCAYLNQSDPVFPPGQVVTYHFLERILLTELLTRVLGISPYRHVETTFLQSAEGGRFEPGELLPAFGFEELRLTVPGLGQLAERLLIETPEWTDRVFGSSQAGSAPIHRRPLTEKDFLPSSFSWGAISFNNHLWGQNGVSDKGGMAIRFDDLGETWIAGAFPTRFERDVILNEICHQLGFSTGIGPRTPKVGSLNGYSPDDILGTYEGAVEGLSVTVEGRHLVFATRGDQGGKIRCLVDDEGWLESRFPSPNLWIEPFAHPESGRTCLLFGQTALVMCDS